MVVWSVERPLTSLPKRATVSARDRAHLCQSARPASIGLLSRFALTASAVVGPADEVAPLLVPSGIKVINEGSM